MTLRVDADYIRDQFEFEREEWADLGISIPVLCASGEIGRLHQLMILLGSIVDYAQDKNVQLILQLANEFVSDGHWTVGEREIPDEAFQRNLRLGDYQATSTFKKIKYFELICNGEGE